MAQRLVTSRYVLPGTYIGQLIRPQPGNLTTDARVCNYVGKGSRLAVGPNLGIRRSFVFEEEMVLPQSAPFVHFLKYPANGVQDLPVRVFNDITGNELRTDEWAFQKSGNSSQFDQVIVSPSAYDPNAVYKIDYQSTSRDVLDPLPVRELREIKLVANSPDRDQFKDFRDFFVRYSFTGPSADDNNAHTENAITSVFPDINNVASDSTVVTSGTYDHNYNRFYILEVMSTGVNSAVFRWSAQRYSGGLDAEAPTPLHSTGTRPEFIADQAVPASLTQDLEFGIKVTINFGTSNFAVGDKFYFNALGPGLIEWDGRYSNTNQFTEFSSIDETLQTGSTGSLLYDVDNKYLGDHNLKYKLKCEVVGGSGNTRFATFVYASYGEIIAPTGEVTVQYNSNQISLPYGVRLNADFGANNFQPGDVFMFEVKAPRLFYEAKDDRIYNFSVSSALNPGADEGIVNGSFSTGTSEGGFGSFTANVNTLTDSNAESGFVVLPDNVTIAIRNAMQGNTSGSRHANGDKYIGSITSEELIDWSLTSQAEELREQTAIFTDVNGSVTGSPGGRYIILNNVYNAGSLSIVGEDSNNPISFVEYTNSRFVGIISTVTEAIKISYEYRGEEPAPGQLYYFTAHYLRPDELYNTPTLFLDINEGRNFLAPSQSDNHLYIMNELAFGNGAPGVYATQVYDADGDGIYTSADVREALRGHESVSRITDLCVLSFFDSLADQLAINERGNDPFEKREQMLYVGAPIGTPIGDIDSEGSLIFLARRTLQTVTTSPAIGTRVLLAPTECEVEVLLDSGSTQTVRLDGSFVAGATAALVNSFADPATSILRKTLAGFSSIQTYKEAEQLLLGQASITFLSDLGAGVYRFEEDITVHTQAEEFQLISATIQKHFVTKVVRREMDSALIGVTTNSTEAAISLIRTTLAGILLGLLGRGLIGDYQDDEGNVRDFSATDDIIIFRDNQLLTQYFFTYAFWLRNGIKRLFGLYAVNTNDFS